MKNITTSIKKKYNMAVFFTPHLDEAVFGAGGMLAELSRHMPLHVVNVFTHPGDGHNTRAARSYLRQRAATSPQSLKLSGAHVINLDYTGALWRKRKKSLFPIRLAGRVLPEFISLYPTHRYHITSGKIHPQDEDLTIELARRFRNMLPDPTKTAVFAPVGFGGHVDRCIVRNATRLAFGSGAYYWLDFPFFAKREKSNRFTQENKLAMFAHPVRAPAKNKLCEQFASQYSRVITNKKILTSPEWFFHE